MTQCWTTDERLSSLNYRKTISVPQVGIEPQPSDDRWDGLTIGDQVAGSIRIWGSEIVFLRFELDKRSSII